MAARRIAARSMLDQIIMRTLSIFLAAGLAALAVPGDVVLAQTASEISPGTQVFDPAGGIVGTVTAVQGDTIIIKTDRLEAKLPSSSFTTAKGKLWFGMTQAQLNAATEQAVAQATASLKPGATVKGTGGAVVGTLEAIDDQFATIKLQSGKLVKIPRIGIVGSADGAVIGLTVAQLDAQLPAGE